MRRTRTLLATYYAYMLEYRGELFLWAVAMSFPLVLMGLWTEAAADAPRSLSPAGFARYFVIVYVIRQLTVVWVIHDFGWHVVSGRLSALLVQPLDPAWRFIAAHRGEHLARLPLLLPLLALCLALFPEAVTGDAQLGPWRPGWLEAVLALILVELSWWVRFVMQYTLSMLAFFMERVDSLAYLIYLPYLFLSGTVAPLEEFPAWAATAVQATPFPYMVWMPAMLLVEPGHFEFGEVLAGILVLSTWGGGLYALNRWAWKKGLAKYSAMGA